MASWEKNSIKKIILILLLVLNTTALTVSLFVLYRFFSESRPDFDSEPILSQPSGYDVSVRNSLEEISQDNPARVKVQSEPAGAKIYIQGHLKGLTPAEVLVVGSVESGLYGITLKKEGFREWERTIHLTGGEFREIKSVLEKK